jgi:ferredoxin
VTLQIRIDRERCIGSGNCSFYAESTFSLDDELKAVVAPDGEDGSLDATADIRAAAEGCPVNAIVIETSTGESD